MTRIEEIEQQASLTVFPWDDVRDQVKFEDGFIEGAKWANKTMIDKACEWLKFNTNWDDEWDDMGKNMNYGMIEEFRKAMEE